jgi:hypothetical protein
MNDRQRLEAIVAVVCKYLPPDGISREDAMREIIGLVDPLPDQFDWASFWHKQYERAAEHATFMGEQVKFVMEWNEKLKTEKSLDWLPKHAAALYITHNDHKSVYESIEGHYDHLDNCEWVSPEERLKAIEMDSVWELQWYPDTPIGSYKVAASSLEAIQKHMMENGNAYR